MPPHNNETLELRITIQYHGVKATQFFSKFTTESEEVVRKDMLELRLPLPKRSNVRLLRHGTAQAFWTAVNPRNTILRQPLQAKLKSDPPPSEAFKAELERLSITNISYKEVTEPTGDNFEDDAMVKFSKSYEGGSSSTYPSSRPNKLQKYRDGDFSASGPSDFRENRLSRKESDRDLYPDLTKEQVERIISDGLYKTMNPTGPIPSTQLARTILFSIRHLKFVEGVSFFDSRQRLPPDDIDYLLAIMFYQRLNTGVPTEADDIFDAMMKRLCTNNDLCRERSLIFVNRALKKLISSTYKKELMPYFFSDAKHPERVLDLVVIDMIPNYPVEMSEEMPHRFGRSRKFDGLSGMSAGYSASSSSKSNYHDDFHSDDGWRKPPPTAPDSRFIKRRSISPPLKIEFPKARLEPPKIIPRKRSPSTPPALVPKPIAPPTGPAAMRTPDESQYTRPSLSSIFVKSTPDDATKLREQIQQLEEDLAREKVVRKQQEKEWKKKLDEQQKMSMELNDNIMAVSLEERTRQLEEETALRNALTYAQMTHDQDRKMMEEELLKERQRRILAEEALEDVRRECRAPFIVPALMEAFIHVSRTTTVLMQGPAVDNGNGNGIGGGNGNDNVTVSTSTSVAAGQVQMTSTPQAQAQKGVTTMPVTMPPVLNQVQVGDVKMEM